jgi:hypothetical protein
MDSDTDDGADVKTTRWVKAEVAARREFSQRRNIKLEDARRDFGNMSKGILLLRSQRPLPVGGSSGPSQDLAM